MCSDDLTDESGVLGSPQSDPVKKEGFELVEDQFSKEVPMKHLSRLAAAVFFSVVLSFSAPALVEAGDSGPEVSIAKAKAPLIESHRTLLLGIFNIDKAQRGVAADDRLTRAMLRRYSQRYWQRAAAVVALEKERSEVEASSDAILRSYYLERVGRVHLATLRLQSEFETWSAPDGDPGPGCFGSISGNVQGPGGPLIGGLVQAFVADDASAGSGFTDVNGDYQIDSLPVGDYFLVTSNSSGLIDEVYDDIDCPGGSCDPTVGSVVSVTSGMTTMGIDFTLAAGGRIGGALTALPGPIPLLLTTVNIFNAAGELVTSTSSGFAGGDYLTETGLPDGSYRAVTADLLFGNLDELYDNIPCSGGLSCDPASGTPIAVTAPNTTLGINFELAPGGKVAGQITDRGTTLPIESVPVGIHDSSGFLISFGISDGTGNYATSKGLSTGDYFAATGNFVGYVDELYDDIACTGGLCDVTTGSTIAVTQGVTTSGIDFALDIGGTFSGTVTRDSDGSPIAGGFILAHSASGIPIGTAETDNMGDYTITTGLGTGSYRASTLNPHGYDDELFDDLPCPFGVCDASAGTPIAVTVGVDTPGIDFSLGGNAITSCGFEDCSICDLGVIP